MNEKEKMMAGEWYDANYDPEIVSDRRKADDLCYAFNNCKPVSEESKEICKQLFIDYDESIEVLQPLYCDYIQKTKIGKNCFIGHGTYFMDGGTVTLGDNVFLGPFCGFYTASHPLDYTTRNKGLEKALPIKVGNNCWFGANCTILPGTTIGDGCVIAAGSVVKGDIPANSVIAGVPAVVKKTIDQ